MRKTGIRDSVFKRIPTRYRFLSLKKTELELKNYDYDTDKNA